MASTGIYENLPLKPLNKDDKENIEHDLTNQKLKAASQSNTYTIEIKPKKRRSTSEIQKTCQQNTKNNPKTSKSVTDMSMANSRQNEINDNSENARKLKELSTDRKSNSTGSPSPNKPTPPDFDDDEKTNMKQDNQHSTPTSTFDDGYESCNSTPYGSGMCE